MPESLSKAFEAGEVDYVSKSFRSKELLARVSTHLELKNKRQTYSEIVLDSLRYCQKEKGLVIHVWCIMPSHLHFIISRSDNEQLSGIVRDSKKFTSKAIIEESRNINESRKEWLLRAFKASGIQLKRITNTKFGKIEIIR